MGEEMNDYYELILSTADAKAIAAIVGNTGRARFEPDAANALTDLLVESRKLPHNRLPADRVAMNARVVYREEPEGEPRSVAIVHPTRANASAGAISVMSPIGRALLGRKRGSIASIEVPGGRAFTVRILDIEKRAYKEVA